jgi:uncharacterized protein YjeT (DUF2065 family)
MMSAEFWYEIAIALCLVFILEGMMPFLYPARWRRLVEQLATTHDHTLRWLGFVSMIVGVVGLYLIR